MNFTHAVAPELPYLRRYARALTGSQALGDAAVRETLEAVLEAPGEFDTGRPARVELYRVFHKLWHPGLAGTIGRHGPLADIAMPTRQALLLTAVEGFTLAEASEILDEGQDALAESLETARATIADALRSRIMIIEDEGIIALHIRSIVTEAGHEVVGVARTHREAVRMARETQPELVLADISLADGSSGIDAVAEILQSIDPTVIFVTAFPERLLTGERVEPAFLVSKPFEPVMLTATIAQALMTEREAAAKAAV